MIAAIVYVSVAEAARPEKTVQTISITDAKWEPGDNRLVIKGRNAGRLGTVKIYSVASNALLDTVTADRGGKWKSETSPEPAPCDVRAASHDTTDEKAVLDAPADCDGGPGGGNQPPVASDDNATTNQNTEIAINVVSNDSDPDGSIVPSTVVIVSDVVNGSIINQLNGKVGYSPDNGFTGTDTFTYTVDDDKGASSNIATVTITVNAITDSNISINSTSQNGKPSTPLPEVPAPGEPGSGDGNHVVLAINDLGMHCGDLDTRISSILPPFQVLLAQVIQRGSSPTLNPAGVSLEYSAASNSNDPILSQPGVMRGLRPDGSTYKTNFWDAVAGGSYDAFYPGGLGITPLASGGFPVTVDKGLPVPNVEELYIGHDGVVKSGDETLTAVQHAMPGLAAPYLLNSPQVVEEQYGDKPFFINFPFGYVAADVNWYEGAGIPFAAYDDFGRENAYPLVRVQAKQGSTTVATIDTVLPISGEASCMNCHSDPADVQNSRTSQPTDTLKNAKLPVVTSMDDPDENMPHDVSVEYAADINLLRLHDLKHGEDYVDTSGDSTPCTVNEANPNGNANCLINQALVQGKPAVCQVCHYTPALDLAQVGPMAGPPGSDANGRNQLAHSSNSNVMHSHHGKFTDLFPKMPAPIQLPDGTIENQEERLAVLENTCYSCHPGNNVQCLRGAMFNGGMLCNDCHGDMQQVGADFSQNVSPTNPAPTSLILGGNFYDPNDTQPRVPWANEPGCGSCHTGDASDNLLGAVNSIINTRDVKGNVDGLRFRQAYRTGDAKATPIVPANKRFSEPAVPVSFENADGTTFDNPGAGNPQLYRVSTGHGGVMCEGCHGATHAEWPNGNPNANDNVTAKQLQGHTGTITECTTCHSSSFSIDDFKGNLDSNGWMPGPHGMHPVATAMWNDKHKEVSSGTCAACHGSDGLGTVLSRTATDRVFECKNEDGTLCGPDQNTVSIAKGTPIGCVECHSNEIGKSGD
jgi:hypothetical protein